MSSRSFSRLLGGDERDGQMLPGCKDEIQTCRIPDEPRQASALLELNGSATYAGRLSLSLRPIPKWK